MRGISKKNNIKEHRFGRLVAIEYCKLGNWLCKCDCGNETLANPGQLRRGGKKSCGCLQEELNFKHGKSVRGQRHSLYTVFHGMKARCYRKSHHSYLQYGGRGIKICEEWLAPKGKGFLAFYIWSIENGYRQSLVIDRIDNNGPYSPENCRWTTDKENSRNKRTNIKVVAFNKVFETLQDACDAFNINYGTVQSRRKAGWDIETALTTLPRQIKRSL